HQLGRDHGPTVWTWYLPLVGEVPADVRRELLDADWKRWSYAVLADLGRAHTRFTEQITALDVWRWGHAMVRPEVGFVWGGARRRAGESLGHRLHFAHTDLSGVALFEEAHFHGVRAAEQVLKTRGAAFETLL
ncbi:MAG: twin-arginine translocation pathway signal, partial [Myxococcales bacterium]